MSKPVRRGESRGRVERIRELVERYPRIVRGKAQLLVHADDYGKWFEVGPVCHVGSGDGCHVRLSRNAAVALLCTIRYVGDGWCLSVESDQTPVRVNAKFRTECDLHHGDLLELPTWGMLFVENRNDDTGDVPKGEGCPVDDPTLALS